MRTMLVLALVLGFACFAIAGDATSEKAVYSNPNGEICPELVDYLNSQDYLTHTHNYMQYEPKSEYGVGVDVVVWENDAEVDATIQAVEIQEKYDFAEQNNSVYIVAKVNLWNMFSRDKAQ